MLSGYFYSVFTLVRPEGLWSMTIIHFRGNVWAEEASEVLLYDFFSKLQSEAQAGLVECPQTHGYLLHSCLGWKIKDPAGAACEPWLISQTSGKLDGNQMQTAGFGFPTNQSIRSPWPKHAPPKRGKEAEDGKSPILCAHCLWLHKGVKSPSVQ